MFNVILTDKQTFTIHDKYIKNTFKPPQKKKSHCVVRMFLIVTSMLPMTGITLPMAHFCLFFLGAIFGNGGTVDMDVQTIVGKFCTQIQHWNALQHNAVWTHPVSRGSVWHSWHVTTILLGFSLHEIFMWRERFDFLMKVLHCGHCASLSGSGLDCCFRFRWLFRCVRILACWWKLHWYNICVFYERTRVCTTNNFVYCRLSHTCSFR